MLSTFSIRQAKFGQIVGFVHPDGLYTDSMKKAIMEKISWNVSKFQAELITQKNRLRWTSQNFIATAGQLKLCEVIPMDLNGGLRIKGYWDLKRA